MSSEETIKSISQLEMTDYEKTRILAAAVDTDVGALVSGLIDDKELLSTTLKQFLKLRDVSPPRSQQQQPQSQSQSQSPTSEEKVTIEQLLNVQQLMDALLQRYRKLEREHSELLVVTAAKDKIIRDLEMKSTRRERENSYVVSTPPPPATSISPSVSPDKKLRRQETALREQALLESHSMLHSEGSPEAAIMISPSRGWAFQKSQSPNTPSPSRRKPVSVRLRAA